MSKKGTKRISAETKVQWFVENYRGGLTGRELVEASQGQFGDGLGKAVQGQVRDALVARDAEEAKLPTRKAFTGISQVRNMVAASAAITDLTLVNDVVEFMKLAQKLGIESFTRGGKTFKVQ